MKYTKSQQEALHSIFELLVGTAPAKRRSRLATLAEIQRLERMSKAELRIKEAELDYAVFKDDTARLRREVAKLKRRIQLLNEVLRHLAEHAADKRVAATATAASL